MKFTMKANLKEYEYFFLDLEWAEGLSLIAINRSFKAKNAPGRPPRRLAIAAARFALAVPVAVLFHFLGTRP